MDKLQTILTAIQFYCDENEIGVFYGNIEHNEGTEIFWKKSSEDDWKKYLEILKKTSTKVLVIDAISNDTILNDPPILEYKKRLDNDELIEFESALRMMKNNQGQVAFFNLNFIYNGACYIYTQLSDWAHDFMTIQNAYTPDLENDFEMED